MVKRSLLGKKYFPKIKFLIVAIERLSKHAILIALFCSFVSCSLLRVGNPVKREMCIVPNGNFIMGHGHSNADTSLNEKLIFVDSFYIDKHEVTYKEYEKCVQAGICKPPLDTIAWYKVYKRKEFIKRYGKYPITYVSWEQANIFCLWLKKRLPSEQEWEKAARGVDGRNYPWGYESSANIVGPSKKAQFSYPVIVQELSDNVQDIIEGKMFKNEVAINSTGTSMVGSHPQGASPYDVEDLAGNVWEWVNDSIVNKYSLNYEKIIKGGSFSNSSFIIQSFLKRSEPKDASKHNIGFRCACNYY